MIPLRDVIPSRTTPYVTTALIVLNTVAWIYELMLPGDALAAFIQRFAVVPNDFAPQSVVTSMFLHAGWLHLIGNMWCLWIFGDNVEDRLGHGRFVVFYLLCGLTAALGHVLADRTSGLPMVGASGAVAGVMGAYFVLYPRSRVLALIPLVVFWEIIEVPAIALLGFWFVLQLFSAGAIAVTASTGGIAFMTHVAGFLAGIAGIYAFRRPPHREPDWL